MQVKLSTNLPTLEELLQKVVNKAEELKVAISEINEFKLEAKVETDTGNQ